MGRIDLKRNEGGFPSDFLDPKVKQTKEYALAYQKAFDHHHAKGLTHSSLGWAGKSFDDHEMVKNRMYARGEQPNDKYKTLFQHKRKIGRGKKNLSHTAIDYNILPIAPRVISNVVGKILGKDLSVSLKAIDPISVSETRKKKHQVLSFLANKEFLDKISSSANGDVNDFSPIPQGAPMPDESTIDEYVDLFFKNEAMMQFLDFINLNMEANEVDQLKEEIAIESVEIGIAGVKSYLDGNGKVKFRRVVIEESIANACRHDDFRDLSRIGEYIYPTIAELRVMWPGQKEEVYLQAARVSNPNGYTNSADHYIRMYNSTGTFPYDDERIRVLDSEWKSVDRISKVVKTNRNGKKRVYNKPYDWASSLNKEEYAIKFPDREVIEREDENWYGAKWIVGTDYVFDHGLKTNMMRESTNISKVRSNFIIIRTECFTKHMIPLLDQIQLDFLKWQQHKINTLPRNMTIEMTALENISLGKGGEKMSPRDALALYYETGIMLWRRTSWRGSEAQFKPIEEMRTQIPEAAMQHFNFILQQIDLLRFITGLPQVTDGTVTNPEIGKGVMIEAMNSVDETMRKLFSLNLKLFKALARNVLDLTIDSVVHFGGDQYKEALGIDSVNFMKIVKDINSRELGIIVEIGPDSEQKAFLQQMILEGEKTGEIDAETAYMLNKEKNPYRVIMMLKQKRKEAQRLAAESEQRKLDGELQKNIESSNVSTENEIKKLEVENELKKDYELFKAQLEKELDSSKTANQILLKKLDGEQKLDLQEEKVVLEALNNKKEAQATAQA